MEKEEADIKDVFYRIKSRNFRGIEGQAIKNSTFQLSTTLAAKAGSLIFTIIILSLVFMILPNYSSQCTLCIFS